MLSFTGFPQFDNLALLFGRTSRLYHGLSYSVFHFRGLKQPKMHPTVGDKMNYHRQNQRYRGW